MNKILPAFLSLFFVFNGLAQTPKSFSSADILQQLKKLEVFGSVLYIAAHPDDENTRLLAYLANERKFRTGYLSLTRGDGGQNLIGDEQGIDLGLIRTQELLAARRVDGAEQFFTRAYDFGYSKSPEETLQKWGHDKILSDVVWVIRNFKPDVIITRFPTTGEGGHGHHTASAMLASEAFEAAGDASKFPEQLKNGVTVWQAKRLLWNTFNFGGNNTQREDQLKIDVGMFNPILGKSYGEMAAESRSQHKSQGFGVPAQRGESFEYFSSIKGDKPLKDLMEGVDVSSQRLNHPELATFAKAILHKYKSDEPLLIVPALVNFRKQLNKLPAGYWKDQKLKEVNKLVEASSGLFLEVTAPSPYAAIGDSLKLTFTFNNRSGLPVKNVSIHFGDIFIVPKVEAKNNNSVSMFSMLIPEDAALTQPYWLKEGMPNGSFKVSDQKLIGKPWNQEPGPKFNVEIEGEKFVFERPIKYKYTDPVKGEIYEPVSIVPKMTLKILPEINVVTKHSEANNFIDKKYRLFTNGDNLNNKEKDYAELKDLKAGAVYNNRELLDLTVGQHPLNSVEEVTLKDAIGKPYNEIREIAYDHIPSIVYFKPTIQKLLKTDIEIAGKNVGYIAGAGDKVPQALTQMGYRVTMLSEEDITSSNLTQFDAVVTGVRAYNINTWLSNAYDVLMQYVKDGGVLLVQYNTNNSIGPVKAKISPYPFTITRNRITDETAAVNFLIPNDPVLNYPNKITQKDFEGWVQERSIYHAENIDSKYRKIFSMKDPGESESDGSLIVADYGKGRFIYTGIVFFRELPAGIPGAYRLFANLIAAPKPAPATDSKTDKK